MDKLFATRYIDETIAGFCQPCILEAIDRNKYVVKFKNNRVSKKVLINDLISCRLAKKLNLPVPKVAIIHICQDLIDMEPKLQSSIVSVGDHFGSLYYSNTTTFTGEKVVLQASNLEEICRIIAFDLWVGNDDRCNNAGNLLINTTNANIMAIDYGNAFYGPDWINDDLDIYEVSIPDFDGEVYDCLRNFIEGENPFDEICTEIENLTYDDIDICTKGIPEEWDLDEKERIKICEFLNNRKEDVRAALESIKNKFPKWRR